MTNEEKILDILASMSLRFDSMDARMDSMENAILKVNIKMETDIEAKLVSLADGHTMIMEQLTPRSRIDDMENEIRFLKTVVFRMNDELQQLKQAQ